MRKDKQRRLERAGWRVGDAKDFLDLADVEAALIDVRIALASEVRARRRAAGCPGAPRINTPALSTTGLGVLTRSTRIWSG